MSLLVDTQVPLLMTAKAELDLMLVGGTDKDGKAVSKMKFSNLDEVLTYTSKQNDFSKGIGFVAKNLGEELQNANKANQ